MKTQTSQKLKKILHRIPAVHTRISSLSVKIFVIMLLIVTLLAGTTGAYFFSQMSKTVSESTLEDCQSLLDQTNSSIETQMNLIKSTLFFFLANPVVRENLQSFPPDSDPERQTIQKIQIQNQLSYLLAYSYPWDANLIQSVYIFSDETTYYHVERTRSANAYSLQRNLAAYLSTPASLSDVYILPPTEEDSTIYFSQNINSEYSLDHIATIVLAIDAVALSQCYSSVNQYKNAHAYVLDDQGRVLLHNDPSFLGTSIGYPKLIESDASKFQAITIDGVDCLAVCEKISKYNLTSFIAIPRTEIFSKLSETMPQYISIILIIALAFVLVTLVLCVFVNRLIRDMMSSIDEVRNGNFDTRMKPYRDLELNRLSDTFNHMSAEIQDLINNVYKKQLLLNRSELNALQSQINPHFLFNVLDTISWYARTADNQEILDIVTPMSSILRTNILSANVEKVTVAEEIKYIGFYLSIQKIRFDDRMEFEILISDDEINANFLPKFCVHTLVENAIVHGIEEKLTKGKISIRFYQKNDDLFIEVQDNGIGFDASCLNLESPEPPPNKSEQAHPHVGLYNTSRRIQLLYGPAYGLRVESERSVGTTAVIHIPIDKGDTQNV